MPITHWSRVTPSKPAIIMADTGDVVTFLELEERSNQAAHLFRHLGLTAGDHIACVLENRPQFLELTWAAHRSGLIYTPISTHLTVDEAEYIIRDSDAKLIVLSERQLEIASALTERLPNLTLRFIVAGAALGFKSWERSIANFPKTPIADQSTGVDMCYSSGTTGKPKGVVKQTQVIAFGEPAAVNDRSVLRFGFDEDTIFLVPNPLYHSAPLRHSMLVQRFGGTVVLMGRFDAEVALKAIDQNRVNYAFFVPTMFVRLLNLPDSVRDAYELSSLKTVTHAAAPCPTPVKEKMIEWLGPIITELYGSTEECGFTAISSDDWKNHKGSIGLPMEGIFHVLDDSGTEVEPGTPGTIWVEGGRQFEYYKDPMKTKLSRNENGWRTIGDVGYVDREGFVYLTDRTAFTINSGGVKIFPKEVEDLLCTHPAVADVAVFGVPDSEFGEQVKAVVELKDAEGSNPELATELIEFCRTRLSRIKVPKSIEFEKLPRNPLGKLMKKVLKERYWTTSSGTQSKA